jgi:hypothetical protein
MAAPTPTQPTETQPTEAQPTETPKAPSPQTPSAASATAMAQLKALMEQPAVMDPTLRQLVLALASYLSLAGEVAALVPRIDQAFVPDGAASPILDAPPADPRPRSVVLEEERRAAREKAPA